MTARAVWERLTSTRTLIAVAIVLMVFAVVRPELRARAEDREAAQQRTTTLANSEQNKETLARLKDCTTPEGKCYQDAQKRTAEAVRQLNEYSRLATACAATLPKATGTTVDQAIVMIDQCIAQRLKPGGP